MKQKWIAVLLSLALVLTLFAACGKKDNANTNDTNNGANDNMENNGTTDMNAPNNGMNGSEGNGSAPEVNNGMGNNGMNNNVTDPNNNDIGTYPTFPNALTTSGAEVAIDDLIDTLGLSEQDLNNAMADMEEIGDSTYRHKLLGQDSEVSYGFDEARDINKVTVKTAKEHADTWRSQLNDVLGATAVEGQPDSWNYSDSTVKMTEDGDHFIITIEKPQM